MRIQDKYSCNDFNDLGGSIDGKNWGGGKKQEGEEKRDLQRDVVICPAGQLSEVKQQSPELCCSWIMIYGCRIDLKWQE